MYTIVNNYNITFTQNTQTVNLPTDISNGTVIYLNNMTNNDITINSTFKIFHYILTPLIGINSIILTPNMLLKFIYTINSITGFSKYSIE